MTMKVFTDWITLQECVVIVIILFLLVIYKVFLKSNNDKTPAPIHMDYSLPGEIKKITTDWGDVFVRVFDPIKARNDSPPIVCLPGINPKLVDEWVPVAHALQKLGHHVIIINFHSNSTTTPALVFRGFSDSNVQKLLRESIMRDHFKNCFKKIIVFGKSWGGKQALQFAASSPNLVEKMCLVAPASSDPLLIQSLAEPHHGKYLPILLAWAKDDKALWFSNTKVWTSKLNSEQLTFVSAENGGHRIVDEYIDPIVKFITEKE